MKQEQDRIRQQELKKQLEDLKGGVKGFDVSEMDLDELDSNRVRAMKLAQLEKEKNELNERLRVTGKRIDHLERAFRKEELKHLPEDYEAQRRRDLEAYETTKEQTLRESQQKHKEDVALKHRLSKLVPVYEKFRNDLTEKRKDEFEKRRRAAERELENKMKQRRKEVLDRRRQERLAREAEEKARAEEEERVQREAEQKAAEEEKKREELARRRAEREEERRYVQMRS
jgi:translation initiation factor 3 subunit A